jgi:hypothetical protein
MMQQVKIFTHESIVHYQMDGLTKVLKDQRPVHVTLNVKFVKSNIAFDATPEEVASIKEGLHFAVYVRNNEHDPWLRA